MDIYLISHKNPHFVCYLISLNFSPIVINLVFLLEIKLLSLYTQCIDQCFDNFSPIVKIVNLIIYLISLNW